MIETELLTFIKNNNESLTLEYKLKPNFNEIKESINAIKKRMHFKILRTIYAFANTKGGELYIGVKDKKQILEGIDDSDRKIVEQKILKKKDKIIQTKREIIELKNGRIVIKIHVTELNIWDKPLFLDGILYIRKGNETKKIISFKEYSSIYDRQLYMFFSDGIKSNLKKLTKQSETFDAHQFVEGLKFHIKSFITKNKLKGYEKEIKKAEDLLDKIRQTIIDPKSISKEVSLIDYPLNLVLIDEFIKVYENIIFNKG